MKESMFILGFVLSEYMEIETLMFNTHKEAHLVMEQQFKDTIENLGESTTDSDIYKNSAFINDHNGYDYAWSITEVKLDLKVETLAEMFLSLTDSQKDKFLRITGNN